MLERWLRLGPLVRWFTAGAVFLVIATTLFYFVPGMPTSPHGTRTHQLGWSLAEAVICLVVGGLFILSRLLRDRD